MAHRTLSRCTITMNQPTDLLQLYRAEALRFPRVNEAEEKRLAARIQSGDEDALACLICANLRLVMSLIQPFRNRAISDVDLISAGNVGLTAAARKFDARVRFYCLAKTYILGQLKKASAELQFSVKLPQGMFFAALALRRSATCFEEKTGRLPSAAELAEESGLPEHRVESYMGILSGAIRLDAPVGEGTDDEGGLTVGETISDGSYEAEQGSGLNEERSAAVYAVLDGMEPRAKVILDARYGIGGHPPMTCAVLAQRFSISRERVRQLQQRAEVCIRSSFVKERD